MTLNAQAWLALVALALVMGLLLLVPAGSIHYWQAWVVGFSFIALVYQKNTFTSATIEVATGQTVVTTRALS